MSILTGVMLAGVIIYVLRLPERYKFLNRKPFNCFMCLSFWCALVAYFIPFEITEPLFCSLSAMWLAVWITK